MNKILCLLLAFVLCLGLCACGENSEGNQAHETKPSQNEMLNAATAFDRNAFDAACNTDFANAEETYVGKIFKLTGVVKEIVENGCILHNNVLINLDSNSIAKLSVDKGVSIVGKVSELRYKKSIQHEGSESVTVQDNFLIIEQAYYLSDVSQVTGEVCAIEKDSAVLRLGGDFGSVYCQVYADFTAPQFSQVKAGDSLSFSGTITRVSNGDTWQPQGSPICVEYRIHNATLVNP